METKTNLSANFTLQEFAKSDMAAKKGIDNNPGEKEIKALEALCKNILQPLRDKLDKPVKVSSGYRCPALNQAVGGAPNSQHAKGEAADIFVPGMSARDVFNIMRTMGIPFDQLILYPSFVHVSYSVNREKRQQVLYANGVKE